MFFSKENKTTKFICVKNVYQNIIRAFGTTVPFSRIENEYLKIKLKLSENKIKILKSVHVIIFI